jgi:methylated-DNA-[protein]-cysteine S-methyltransferase
MIPPLVVSRTHASTRKQRVAACSNAANLSGMQVEARPENLHYEEMESPVGRLRLIASDTALVGIWFEHGRDALRGCADLQRQPSPLLARVRTQLEEYFAGVRRDFDLPLDPRGTEFQRRVWTLLTRIAYGDTTTYGALAGALGDVRASRAVGLANGRNPIPIVIPCHRVIGVDGSLTGFGGGLPIKRKLLDLERATTQPRLL